MKGKNFPLKIKQFALSIINRIKGHLMECVNSIHLRLLNYIGFIVIILFMLIIFVLALIRGGIAGKLDDQQIVSRWTDGNDYAAVSLFFPYGTKIDSMAVLSAENTVTVSLNGISMVPTSDSQRLWVDCFIEQGTVTAKTDRASESLKAYGIRGDYFLFHPMEFVSGGYMPSDSVMKDYVIIDELTAWNLFGAIEVDGMYLYIGGVPHLITGVVKVPDDKLSKAGGSCEKVIYLSCESLEAYGTVETALSYELLMPEPYEGFAFEAIHAAFTSYEKTGVWVDNSKRFGWRHLYDVFKARNSQIMQTKPVIYPYWENVALYKENICMHILIVQFVLAIITFIVFVSEIFSMWRMISRHFLEKKLSKYHP